MKINKVYINKEGAPMVSKTGWPTPINPNAEAWAQKEYLENLKQAKRDAVPLIITGVPPTSEVIGPDEKFIEVNIDVEFMQQMMNPDNKWIDCFGNSHNISWYTSLRWIARVVPAKQENGAHSYTEAANFVSDWKSRAIKHISESKDRCECELFVEKYFGLKKTPSETFVPIGADFGNLVNMLTMFRDEQLAAAQERVKELEEWQRQSIELSSPILDYCQNPNNARRLNIKPGERIFKRVLEILENM